MSRDPLIRQRIRRVAERLGPLRARVVFIGGAIADLLVTDPVAPLPRPTKDVDLVIDVASFKDHVRMRQELLALGFKEDASDGAPICRWLVDDVQVDVMPADEKVLGFSNRWYPKVLAQSEDVDLGEGLVVRVVTAPLFVATKLEAFAGRGGGDSLASHDLEDLLAVIDGREAINAEIEQADHDVREYIARSMQRLIDDPRFIESLPGHLPGDLGSQARLPMLVARLRRIAAL